MNVMSAVSDGSPPGPGPNPASASAPALGAALPAMVEAPSISTALIKKRKSGYYADFHSLVQSSSPYRYLDENEVVEKYLPEGTFFFCLLGVIVKRNPVDQNLQRDEIVLHGKCISNVGVEIASNLYDGQTVFSKLDKQPNRDIFTDLSRCVGPKWFSRRPIQL